MDRSRQVFMWLLYLCFSVVPFWGAVAIENSDELLSLSSESLQSAYESLPQEVQDELFWKRTVIGAIDATREVNDALGFHDPNLGLQKKVIVLGTWTFAAGSAFFVTRGWLDVYRTITPDKLRPRHKGRYNQLRKLSGKLLDQEIALEVAENRLYTLRGKEATQKSALQEQQAKVAQAEKPAVPAREGTAGQTAQAEKPAVPAKEGTASQTAQAEKPAVPAKEGTASQTAQAEKPATPAKEGTASQTAQTEKPAVPAKEGTASQTAQTEKTTATPAKEGTQTAQTEKTTATPAKEGTQTAQVEEGKKPATAPAKEGTASQTTAQAEKTTATPAKEGTASQTAQDSKPKPSKSLAGQLREFLFGRQSPTVVPKEPVVQTQATTQVTTQAQATQAAKQVRTLSAELVKTTKAVERQRGIVSNLRKDLKDVKTQLNQARMMKWKGVMSRFAYGMGHTLRWVSIPGLYIAGGLVQIALAGDAILILFDKVEDMEDLREQYAEDIEIVVSEVANEIEAFNQ